jgi:uncharacterized phage-associated protein
MKRDDVCDYIIVKIREAGETLNQLKLQKLMYYVQAWHLAFQGSCLFDGKFQAWVHGPVSRELYDRFAGSKSLYSEITRQEVRQEFDMDAVLSDGAAHIDPVLEVYGGLTGSQLEEMTRCEDPWIKARAGCRPSERCENEISESLMAEFYSARLETAQ